MAVREEPVYVKECQDCRELSDINTVLAPDTSR